MALSYAESEALEGLNSADGADSFPDPAQDYRLPGMPSGAHRGPRRILTRMAALHRLRALLSGGGWHSCDARTSGNCGASARVKFCSLMLTSRHEISLLVHKS